MDKITALSEKLSKGLDSTFYVAVVPVNPQGQVLIGQRREDGIWTTPAGGADPGEDPRDVAVRECWEEANLIVDKNRLELIRVKEAPNGKPVWCYLYRTSQVDTNTKCDPDKECKEWTWTSPENLPTGLSRKKNQNRLETINQAFMKFHGLIKSSKIENKWIEAGIKVEFEHTKDREKAKKIALDHLNEDPDYYKDWDNKEKILFQDKAPKIEKSGGEGSRGGRVIGRTKSGKPIYAGKKVHEYAADGATADDHHEAAQHHYAEYEKTGDKAHQMKWQAHRDRAETMRRRSMKKSIDDLDCEFLDGMLKSDVRVHTDGAEWSKEGEDWKRTKNANAKSKEEAEKARKQKISDIKRLKGKVAEGKNYQSFIDGMSDVNLKKYHEKTLVSTTQEAEMEKSVTQMGNSHGDPDIRTEAYAVERAHADPELLERLYLLMEDFGYGDTPRELPLDAGTLYLSKIDDGMYSGFFRKRTVVEDGEMLDNSNVRIEKQTLPTLAQFLVAKDWYKPEGPQTESDDSPMEDEQYQALNAKLEEISDGVEAMIEQEMSEDPQESDLDKKIRVLELVNKLLS